MTQQGQAAMQALIALFEREGYTRVEPAVMQPADVFIELSGEDIRRRLFVTEGYDGEKLCLRPEYTIPVCRDHIAQHNGHPANYSYLGPVFRQRIGESGEFLQAGIESLGRKDITAADAEILALALDGLTMLGLEATEITFSDMGVLAAIIDALKVAPSAKRRILRAVVSGTDISALSTPEAVGLDEHAGLLNAIDGLDPKAARAMVEDLLSIAGIDSIGGRTPGDIAARFLSRAAAHSDIPDEAIKVLEVYQGISGDPDQAALKLRNLAETFRLDLSKAIDTFEERTGFMAARGINIGKCKFSAKFARNLDYYSGFIFEIFDLNRKEHKPVVGGGRYDGLVQHLGAKEAIPAVGCSFWLDRLPGNLS
ncbi:ATP phosphoribosyltransferase regulatory subunit [Microvirga sp. W0021]|uniref:ATP phosphoribosyltransferase regulatory subunit n=1 Tax=Hohaiivirga grylli TaxID=3133970 RepID=A0ABV0BGY4_9HYPH